MRWRFAYALMLVGCSLEPSTVEIRVRREAQSYIDGVDRHNERKRTHIANVETLRDSLDRQSLTYARAEQNFQLAIERYREAFRASETAAATAERARILWELYQRLVVIAAAVDAHNIDSAATPETFERMSLTCERTSTRQFRALKMSEGVSVDSMDVDHIIPRSLGGADHILNYHLLPLSENRAWGAGGGMTKCLLVGPLRCALAIMVSIQCGWFRGF